MANLTLSQPFSPPIYGITVASLLLLATSSCSSLTLPSILQQHRPSNALASSTTDQESRIGSDQKVFQRGIASYYSDSLAGKPTASGEPYDPSKLTAAHRTLPFGTVVKVSLISSHRSVVVRINDRGPSYGSRVIDLSKAAAKALGIQQQGLAEVELIVTKDIDQ